MKKGCYYSMFDTALRAAVQMAFSHYEVDYKNKRAAEIFDKVVKEVKEGKNLIENLV